MEITPTNTDLTTLPVSPTAAPTKTKSKWQPYALGLLAGLLIAVIAGAVAYTFGMNSNTKNDNTQANQATVTPTSTTMPIVTTTAMTQIPKKTGTEIIHTDPVYNQYNNYDLGFSIKYPAAPKWSTSCDTSKLDTQTLTQIVEDFPNKTVYVAFKTESLYGLNNTCKKTNITLDVIKNGIPSDRDRTSDGKMYPTFYAFHYATVNNDTELAQFGNKIYDVTYQDGKLCTIKSKTAFDSVNKDYNVRLDSNAGQNGYDDGTKCPLNFNYNLTYSESNKIALTWSIGQQPAFGGDYTLDGNFLH